MHRTLDHTAIPHAAAVADLADIALDRLHKDSADLSRAIRSQRFETIVAMCKRQASHMGATSIAAQLDLYEQALRTLCNELQTLDGSNATPQPGCVHILCKLGDGEALVEFEGDDGDSATFQSLCPRCALVNGKWIDADQFADSVQEAWIERGADWLDEQRQEAGDMQGEARAEARALA